MAKVSPLFQFLSEVDSQRLNSRGILLSKKAGDALLLMGEPVPGIYLIDEGTCGVYTGKVLVQRITIGGVFGEMSFLDGNKASATVRVSSETAKIRLFPHEVVADLIKTHPSFGISIYRGIAAEVTAKIRATNERISSEAARAKIAVQKLASETQPQSTLDMRVVEEFNRFIKAIEESVPFVSVVEP